MGFDDFEGNLKSISPEHLINKNTEDELEIFFLTLSVIYNDLKGLVFFETFFTENYRAPNKDEVSTHAGEYGGILVQIQKTFISIIREFFEFLKENKKILTKGEFIFLLEEKVPKEIRDKWHLITKIACGESPDTTPFTKALIKIRNNIGFHYYQSGAPLRKAFLTRFFEKTKSKQNQLAYFSLGEDMKETRFYFADASVQQFLVTMSYETQGNETEDDIFINKDFQKFIKDTIDVMNFTIFRLLKAYIQYKRY